ncbi:MAG: hypothetical protein OXE94_14980 [Aestuariivita sp.]|nr:hypothetical protein [Aestuariivita sp.]MCY4202684.1 hypothetical protein [Aestuariivita sp.]MCY4287296.1 hypothetical protein [Aestuariivita sp.]MCY4346529.1 hypothetical protein [Aestuariivita sp.]
MQQSRILVTSLDELATARDHRYLGYGAKKYQTVWFKTALDATIENTSHWPILIRQIID